MPFYPKLNILVVHIPKTGGSSICEYFYNKDDSEILHNRNNRNINENMKYLTEKNLRTEIAGYGNNIMPEENLKSISLQHQTLKSICKYKNLLGISFDINLTIFTIIRNPYSRIMSDLFHFQLIEENVDQEGVFNIIRNYINTEPENLDNHNIPQYKFLVDENDNLNKNIKILKTESLNKEMVELGYNDFNYHIGNRNFSKNIYLSYLNKDSINLINNYYDKDFILFGYDKLN